MKCSLLILRVYEELQYLTYADICGQNISVFPGFLSLNLAPDRPINFQSMAIFVSGTTLLVSKETVGLRS